MPTVRMLTATIDTILEWSLPEASTIEEVFQEIPAAVEQVMREQPNNAGSWLLPGAWAGPPRITRRNRTVGYTFTAAAPWVVPDYTADYRRIHQLTDYMVNLGTSLSFAAAKNALYNRLAPMDSLWNVDETAYNPAVNGTLEFWASGRANQTTSRGLPPGMGGVFEPGENPVGPNQNNVPPGFFARGGFLDNAVVPIVIGGVVLWLVVRNA